MNSNKAFIVAIIIMLARPSLYGMQDNQVNDSKNIAFSFDLDDVISGKDRVGFNDFIPLAGMFWHCPMLATAALPHNQQAITNHAHELVDAHKYNGSTNIIRGVITYLKEHGYGDLFSYEKQINKMTQKPFPVLLMIANIQALKQQGFTIVGATNQDCEQYKVYRAHLQEEHKIDLKKVFDAVVTTPVYHHQQPAANGLVYKHQEDDHIYVTRQKEHVKPNPDYFRCVEQVVKRFNPNATQIIHTDDKEENADGAEHAGLKSIHFKLAGETVRKTRSEDLEATITAWEKELASAHGIYLKK